jgi:hypothetical protein
MSVTTSDKRSLIADGSYRREEAHVTHKVWTDSTSEAILFWTQVAEISAAACACSHPAADSRHY